jgi:peptidoglycan pentaglycine glycine transferase (the first glycine)
VGGNASPSSPGLLQPAASRLAITAAVATSTPVSSDEKDWDAYIAASPDGHLLQSYRWGEFKSRHGWTPERFAVETPEGSAAAQVLWRQTPLGPLGYVPRGPALQSPQSIEAARTLMGAIHAAAIRRHAIGLKVEPNTLDHTPWPALAVRPSRHVFQPKATLLVDLLPDVETLRARQHPKWRYNTGLAARKGVTVRWGDESDIPAFFRLSEVTGARDGFATRSENYYREILRTLDFDAHLLLAEHEGEIVAGILVASFNQEAIYLYGASGQHKRNLMPNHLLQWEAIRWAREHGFARYDFWGVPNDLGNMARDGAYSLDLPEPQPHHLGDLWGVYRFKKGFGGHLKLYAGAYDYVYNPLAYFAWEKALPMVRRMLKRAPVHTD